MHLTAVGAPAIVTHAFDMAHVGALLRFEAYVLTLKRDFAVAFLDTKVTVAYTESAGAFEG
jgi:hypothetical protein